MLSEHNLIWVDMEMTGLIPEQHRVIEIATSACQRCERSGGSRGDA